MNIEFDSYKQKLNDCRPALDGLAQSLNLDGLKNELERLHAMHVSVTIVFVILQCIVAILTSL